MGMFSKVKQVVLDDAFFRACRKGNVKKAQKLLKRGADINAVTLSILGSEIFFGTGVIGYPVAQTPLHAAVINRHYKVVEMLICSGANPNVFSEDGLSPLHYASALGLTSVVEILVKAGANVQAISNKGLRAEDFARDRDFQNIEEIFKGIRLSKEAQRRKEASMQEGWHLNKKNKAEVIHVSNNSAGYCLTEIFNFNTRKQIIITRNIHTNVETQSYKFFDDFKDKRALEQAIEKLHELGGAADRKNIYSTTLDKIPSAKKPF